MKEILKKYKVLFILAILIIVLVLFYFIREYIASREIYTESYLNGEEYIMNPKKYGVNEYSPINITEEQLASIYLNDFKNQIFNDVNYAYDLLNLEYRNTKFNSIDDFIAYANSLNYKEMVMERYSIDKNTISVYMKDGQKYIFKIISVMEYEVYLDDITVEI